MGDTLGVYGIPTGSYPVLPVLGPSTLRDAGGSIAGSAMEGVARNGLKMNCFLIQVSLTKEIYGYARTTVTGLNARSLIGFRYGDLNSPFEYDLVKAMYYNYRKIQGSKIRNFRYL